jgi:hypothetical protein
VLVARFLPLLALTAAFVPGVATAYHLLGPGGASCVTWTADRRTNINLYQIDQAWVLGFLSGVGYMGNANLDPLQGLNFQAVTTWLDNYCQRYPLQGIEAAAKAFLTAHPR